MGLLDDAIKEHLDLKRRRGADPAEVERAEQEALGPVRRNRDPADALEPEAAADETGGFAYDHADDADWSHDASPEASAETADDLAEPGFADHAASEPEALVEDELPPAPRARGWSSRGDERPEPASSRPLSDMGGGETVEYNVEDVLAADHEPDHRPVAAPHGSDAPDDEDVLEETPEFLQDTPDHDRLWFEQRPPRDFDFDG
ncbi:MAG TPA: hypothetical protein VIK04_02115 [Solirubrobacteraceae bacterium]